MPEDDRSYRKPLAVGERIQVRLGGQWHEARIVHRSERGKTENLMAQTIDGTFVSVQSAAQWRKWKERR